MNSKLILITIIILLKIAWIVDANCASSFGDPNELICYYSKYIDSDDNFKDFYNETLQGNYSTLKISNYAGLRPSNSSILAQHLINGLNNLPNLKHLIIDHSEPIIEIMFSNSGRNESEALQPSIFDNLAQLETLKLRRNELKNLPENTFANLKKLKEVDLVLNKLKSIPDYMFTSKPNGNKPLESTIERIQLSENQVQNISEHSFSFLTNLKYLSLDYNNIINIAPNAFSSLNNLEELNLRLDPNNNQINQVEFSNLKQLKILTLNEASENLLKSLQAGKLEKLDLFRHQLKNISIDLFDKLRNLEKLYLSHGHIYEIQNGSFSQLKNLAELHLNFNKIKDIKVGTFDGGSQLIELNLNNNEIKNLSPELFDPLTNLEELLLGGNQLTSIPKDLFRSMKKIKLLGLNFNKLTTLPENIFEPVGASLEYLDLAHNEFEYIPSAIFKPLNKLEVLYLYSNKLKVLDEDTFYLPSLIKVDVSSNELTNLSRNLLSKDHSNVEYFYVNKNKLTSMEDEFIENSKLKIIKLQCNPLENLHRIELILKLKDITFESLCSKKPFFG